IGEYAKISNSLITEGCEIEGIVENSVLASGVKVARGAIIKDSIIMRNVTIAEGATINYSIIDSDTKIGAGSIIGHTKSSSSGIALIGSELDIKPGSEIAGGEMVDSEWLAKNK
ncbi:MAG: glucose-1-phosphate adenylyltransferase, partial [Clostridia bacterium]|nr:glucose-1-phosphate adenylyltransferase [Clostridia bacterium]